VCCVPAFHLLCQNHCLTIKKKACKQHCFCCVLLIEMCGVLNKPKGSVHNKLWFSVLLITDCLVHNSVINQCVHNKVTVLFLIAANGWFGDISSPTL